MFPRIARFSLAFFFGILVLTAPRARADETMFPFVVSYEAPDNVTDVSAFLDAPAGKHGFIRVEGDRFVHDGGEIRFWGTNLSGAANFPTHEQADRIAARLAKFGYNCVRLHWIDAWDIFGGWNPKNHTDFDPERVDRLHYVVYALKQRGIYVNVNLHVARWLDDRDGFPHKDKRPTYDKGVGNFYPAMIEKQKEYARMLLTQVNPYTKLSLAEDPCVAMVEISNEDSIVVEWCDIWNGSPISRLPDPYGAELQKQWNAWLKRRYDSTAALREAWNMIDEPLGEEMLPRGDFETPFTIDGKDWYWQTDTIVDCDATVRDGLLRMDVCKLGGVPWVPQIGYHRFRIEKGVPYTLSFRIRADKNHRLHASVLMDHEPWTTLGTSNPIEVDGEWETFTYKFFGTETDEAARFAITGLQVGWYELDDVTLRRGGNFGFPRECTLETGTIPILDRRDADHLPKATRDWLAFLVDIERDYWLGMDRFLKDELGVKQPVSGTQLGYGSLRVQAELDYCDDHAYWNHPAWPNKSWDRKDWYVRDRALADASDYGTFGTLALRRVSGKPYTVSEYNHPYPNQYSGEGLPMLAALGAFQRWNGFFQYTYAHRVETEPTKLSGYFDMDVQALQLVHSPACAAMFSQGLVRDAKETLRAALTAERELDLMTEPSAARSIALTRLRTDIDRDAVVRHATEIVVSDAGASENVSPAKNTKNGNGNDKASSAPLRVVSDTGEIAWQVEPGKVGSGVFTVVAPRVKVLSGFVAERKFSLGDVELAVGKTRLGFATVSLLERNGRYLLAATGAMHNTGGEPRPREKVKSWEPDDAITLEDRWGEAPVLCEGIPLELRFAFGGDWRVWPLDSAGSRKTEEPIVFRNGTVQLGPEQKTLWYEIVPVR